MGKGGIDFVNTVEVRGCDHWIELGLLLVFVDRGERLLIW